MPDIEQGQTIEEKEPTLLEIIESRITGAENTLIAYATGEITDDQLICPVEYIKKEMELGREYIQTLKIIGRFAGLKNKKTEENTEEE